MITGDLDRALASALAAAGDLPFTGGTWRPAPGGSPLGYATSLAPAVAARASRPAHDVAAALAGHLSGQTWITAVRPAGNGYLTIEVTPQALAASAAAMAAAGPACADSAILAGQAVTAPPWPDLAAEPGWPQAWLAQARAMTGRLAAAAGASVHELTGPERGTPGASADTGLPSPVSTAVACLGADAVRYWLARLPQRSVPRRGPPLAALPGPFAAVQQAHAEAASTLRWAADLGIERVGPGDRLAELLGDPAEQALLSLLSYLPVRVAAAARRRRPDELPRYLEQLGQAWLRCRRARPALPFGGRAAPRDAVTAGARLLLADAARAALAAGLGLTGVGAAGRM